MNYCMECGAKLERRYLEQEGMIPYCPCCGVFRFPVFSTAVSLIVRHPQEDALLLIQQYSRKSWVLVSGYIDHGENAEHAAQRELMEEMGMHCSGLRYLHSEYFAPSNTLMLCFSCTADTGQLGAANDEIDAAAWFSPEQARTHIRPHSIAQRFLEQYQNYFP